MCHYTEWQRVACHSVVPVLPAAARLFTIGFLMQSFNNSLVIKAVLFCREIRLVGEIHRLLSCYCIYIGKKEQMTILGASYLLAQTRAGHDSQHSAGITL